MQKLWLLIGLSLAAGAQEAPSCPATVSIQGLALGQRLEDVQKTFPRARADRRTERIKLPWESHFGEGIATFPYIGINSSGEITTIALIFRGRGADSPVSDAMTMEEIIPALAQRYHLLAALEHWHIAPLMPPATARAEGYDPRAAVAHLYCPSYRVELSQDFKKGRGAVGIRLALVKL